MRESLAALGVAVVYETDSRAFERAALDDSHANVVIVNLDEGDDESLDAVYDLLDDSRYRVIFNDGDVSATLTGWDQARWMRHLGSKVLGQSDIDPPRPAGAEPVPARVSAAPASPSVAPAAVVVDPIAAMPRESVDEVPVPAEETIEIATIDLDEIAALLDYRESDLASSDAAGTAFAAPTSTAESGGHSTYDPNDLGGLLDGLDLASDPVPPPGASTDAFEFDAATGEDADLGEEFTLDTEGDDDSTDGAFEVLADNDSLDSLGNDGVPDGPFVALAGTASDEADEPSILGELASTWSLEDMLDDPGVAPPPPPSPSTFGIETMTPQAFLAPDAESDAEPAFPSLAEGELSLELIPLDEAVAPTQLQSLDHENWLDPDSLPRVKVTRVWVLGASIGGPESVREFLGAFPRDYPALFLLAQHLGDEFVDMMTKQLSKATALTVRTPTHGERVGHGEVVVVPTSHRLLVDAQGVVVLERVTDDTEYRPSINRVIEDVADRFGANAGAIIFSGMSDDAVKGCTHLADKGGCVYAQRQDTCVVSTMIDSVCETGVVEFLGSPAELAARLLADAA